MVIIRAATRYGKILHELVIAFRQESQMTPNTLYVEKTRYLPVENTLWVQIKENVINSGKIVDNM